MPGLPRRPRGKAQALRAALPRAPRSADRSRATDGEVASFIALQRRSTEAPAQLLDPHADFRVGAGCKLQVALIRLERALRLLQIQVTQHPEVQIRIGVMRIDSQRLLIGPIRLLKAPKLAIDDADLVERCSVVRITLDRSLQCLLRL